VAVHNVGPEFAVYAASKFAVRACSPKGCCRHFWLSIEPVG